MFGVLTFSHQVTQRFRLCTHHKALEADENVSSRNRLIPQVFELTFHQIFHSGQSTSNQICSRKYLNNIDLLAGSTIDGLLNFLKEKFA